MTTAAPAPRDLDFLLYEVLDSEGLTARPRFAEYSRETFDAVIASLGRTVKALSVDCDT